MIELNLTIFVRKLLREKTFTRIAHFCCTKGCNTSKFCGENFHEYPQNCETCESFLPRKFPAIQYSMSTCFNPRPKTTPVWMDPISGMMESGNEPA